MPVVLLDTGLNVTPCLSNIYLPKFSGGAAHVWCFQVKAILDGTKVTGDLPRREHYKFDVMFGWYPVNAAQSGSNKVPEGHRCQILSRCIIHIKWVHSTKCLSVTVWTYCWGRRWPLLCVPKWIAQNAYWPRGYDVTFRCRFMWFGPRSHLVFSVQEGEVAVCLISV